MISIRPATLDDLDATVALDPIPGRREVILHAIQRGECHIALKGEAIAAYAILTNSFFGCDFVDLLIVGEPYRRQGFGIAMITYLKALSKPPKLFTSANESNLPMQGLMQTTGFRHCGMVDALDEGDPELFYVWEHLLHPPQLGSHTCVIRTAEGKILTSDEHGILPPLRWLREDSNILRGAEAADKVIGKAAAMLFAFGGVKKLWAGLMSEAAIAFLKSTEISYLYKNQAAQINNREGTDICPMERRALPLSEPAEAFNLFDQIIPR